MIATIIKTAVRGKLFGFKKPVHLILHVTSRCNSRCGMCFAWQRLNKKEADLSLKEIEKIAKDLPNLVFLDISGGEPFLRSDLDKVIEIFAKYSPQAYVNLPTNGLMPEIIAKTTERILKNTNLNLSLNLSLDGLAGIHDSIRGVKGIFEKVLETYRKLLPLKKKYPQLSVKVATVVSVKNLSSLKEFGDWVKKEMPEIDFHTLIWQRGNPKDKSYKDLKFKDLANNREIFFDIWKKYQYGQNMGFLGNFVGNKIHEYLFFQNLKTIKRKRMSLACLAGQAGTVIYNNGDLVFCELRTPLGNLHHRDFESLWQSPIAQKQRQEIKAKKCFCTNGCNMTDNFFLNPDIYPSMAIFLARNLLK
jgi:MoaA/NifB/PqqE/SkfB family radical SAM enzyme